MSEDPEQAANDAWQTAFHEAAYRFSVSSVLQFSAKVGIENSLVGQPGV
jgi:hypothetical protein